MMFPKWWTLLGCSIGLLGRRTSFLIRDENIDHILNISSHHVKQFTTLSAADHFQNSHSRHQNLSSDHIKMYFQRLDLQVDSTIQDIKDAYIRLARRYHPDAQTSEASSERFTEVHCFN